MVAKKSSIKARKASASKKAAPKKAAGKKAAKATTQKAAKPSASSGSKKTSANSKKLPRLIPQKINDAAAELMEKFGLNDDPIANEIARRLRDALTPASLFIKNLTKQHKKHAESKKSGGGHYSLFVVSDLFSGLQSLQRERWIHSLLGDLLDSKKIHALEMKLKDSEEHSTIEPSVNSDDKK
jgi:BolA family transcriptional regulator, general stress-responsive regulator